MKTPGFSTIRTLLREGLCRRCLFFRQRRSARYERLLLGVASDCLDRAAFHGFLTESFLFRSLGLLEDIGVTTIVVAREVGRSRFATQVAGNALVVAVKGTSDILGIFVGYISHDGGRLRSPVPIATVFSLHC